MRIIKGFRKFFESDKKEISHEELIEQKYKKNVKAEDVDDPIQATADSVIEMIKDPNTDSEAVLAATIDSDTPAKVFMNVVKQIAQDPSIPNGTIAKAIETSTTNVPDERILKILEGIPFKSAYDRRTLIKNIDDQGIREEQILFALSKYYESDFSKSSDMDVEQRLRELYSYLDFDNKEIDSMAQRIVAKQMAVMYNRFNGGVMPQRYKAIPSTTMEKMMEANMPQLVQEEYTKLFPEDLEKFDIKIVRQAILRELAIEVVAVYNKTKMFVIPESDAMTKLTDDEISYFMGEIFNKVTLPEKEETGARIDIKQQIKAEYDVDQHAQRELDSKLNMLTKGERIQLLQIFNAIVESKRLVDTNKIVSEDISSALDVIGKLGSTGTLESLMRIPAPDRRAVIKAIGETVDKRFTQEKTREDSKPDIKAEPESPEL